MPHRPMRSPPTAGRREGGRSVERQIESRDKTGVFVGSYAVNPATGGEIPVFIADYVLMGYGTGAIMAVPGQDDRDWAFAEAFDLPIVRTVQPPADWPDKPYLGEGPAINSANESVDLNGLGIAEAKHRIIEWLERTGRRHRHRHLQAAGLAVQPAAVLGRAVPHRLRPRRRAARALPESMLPVVLPDVDDYSPKTFAEDDETSEPEAPLSRATEWVNVTLDLGEGPKTYRRDTNTMPNWAGSCWYELRYLDPHNEKAPVDPEIERYWMGPQWEGDCGGVDLYVGGAEHAVLHLLYSRFWHKVLYDLGHVSSFEPYRRLYNQGLIQAYEYTDRRGFYVDAHEVTEHDHAYWHGGEQVNRQLGRMGKSRKNAVAPDEMYESYGADTMRLYEMFSGPLDQSRPWETKAVVGVYRLLQRIWRNVVDEETGETTVVDGDLDDATQRVLHRTIAAVRDGMERMRFNVSVAKITELNNHLTARYPRWRRAPGRGRTAGAAAGAAGAAHRRGAVVAARPPRFAGHRALPRSRRGVAGRRDGGDPGADQRQGPGPDPGTGRRRGSSDGGRGPRRRPGRGAAGRHRHGPQGRRRPRPPRSTSWWPDTGTRRVTGTPARR